MVLYEYYLETFGIDNILKSIKETRDKAKQTGRLCYLYDREGKFHITFSHVSKWFYRAYPGGRHEFSFHGAKVMRDLELIE